MNTENLEEAAEYTAPELDGPESELPEDVVKELWNRRTELVAVTARLVAAHVGAGHELPEAGSEDVQELVARFAEVAEAIIGHADVAFDASVQAELVPEAELAPDGTDGLP